MLTIASIGYRDSTRALDIHIARSNARFAATRALAELQNAAGMDQAATATALPNEAEKIAVRLRNHLARPFP